MANGVLELIKQNKIVAILRGLSREQNAAVMEGLVEAGITSFEVTLNTDGAFDILEEASKRYEGVACVGAGTVLNEQDAIRAISSGAQFLITPHLSEQVLSAARQRQTVVIPGVFSPTEIVRATEFGCDMVKLFPASSLGSDYIKQVRAPLSTLSIMAVGGIGLHNMGDYFNAGAVAVGLGSSLIPASLVEQGDVRKLKQHFAAYMQAIPR